MKVVCTQENLKNGLLTVSRIISNSNTLPILNNVLLKTENGLLTLSATNLELAITTTVRCKIEEEGTVCLPAKTITELVNNLPNINVTVQTTDNEAIIVAGTYNTKVKTLPSDEFPLIPTVESGQKITLDALVLKQSLDSVMFAASTSETQPEISGVLLAPADSKLKFVATDRYRLAEKVLPSTDVVKKSVIIPHRTVLELSRVLTNQDKQVDLILTDNQLAVTVEHTQMISRLIDGQYPDYQQIIPENFTATVSVSRQELTNALKTSGIFSRATGSVVMSYGPGSGLKISAVASEVGESQVELETETTGESGSITLNYRYVLDAITVMTAETIVIKVVNEGSPVIFRAQGDDSYIYLVMPIKS